MLKIYLLFVCLFFLHPDPVLAHSNIQVVEMSSEGFSPDPVTVDTNSTVIFINKDNQSRWPASNVHPTHDLYSEFDPKSPVAIGKSWAFKPKEVGEWKYHDHLFPHFRGTLIVEAEKNTSLNNDNKLNEVPKSRLDNFKNMLLTLKTNILNLFKLSNPLANFFTSGKLTSTPKEYDLPTKEEFIELSAEEQMRVLDDIASQKAGLSAWQYVKTTFQGEAGSSGNVHDLAHFAGSLLFKKGGFEKLKDCSTEFSFGCYHGFLDEAFAKSLDRLNDAHDACLQLGSVGNGPAASCIHGIGHGVASFYSSKDLQGSLNTCRKLISSNEYCFDGVFMEFARSAPDSYYKKEAPYFPCDELEKKYGYVYSFSCGRNQPSLLMQRFKMTFDQIVPICIDSTSKPFKEACIDALGFAVASTQDPKQIIQSCQSLNDPQFSGVCAQAAAGELVFQEAPNWYEKSQTICNAFVSKNDCLAHVQRLIKDYRREVKINFSPLQNNEDENSYIRKNLQVCFGIDGANSCYKQAATSLFTQFGLKKTLNLLKSNEQYPEVYARCHEVTHYLSRFEYDKQKSIPKVYAQCDSTCHGGCYHGALEAFLKETKQSSDSLDKTFTQVCGKMSDYQKPLEYNECLHGLGHAAMFVTDMELKESLKSCDLLTELDPRERCYSGVFMENSSSSTSLDHASKYIKADDPFYPCNILEEKYQPLCWQYQSSYFSIINHQDWVKVASICLKIPSKYQDKCFRTIGTNQVGFTSSLLKMKEDCDLMPSAGFIDICVEGVVSSLAYRFVDDSRKLIDFCKLVNPANKERCFKQVGVSFLDWSSDKNLAREKCQQIGDSVEKAWCLQPT